MALGRVGAGKARALVAAAAAAAAADLRRRHQPTHGYSAAAATAADARRVRRPNRAVVYVTPPPRVYDATVRLAACQ